MEAQLFATTGRIETIRVVDTTHIEFTKDLVRCALRIDPTVYRGVLVDSEYQRILWDTDVEFGLVRA